MATAENERLNHEVELTLTVKDKRTGKSHSRSLFIDGKGETFSDVGTALQRQAYNFLQVCLTHLQRGD